MTHGRAVRQFRVGCSVKTIGAMCRWYMGADTEKGTSCAVERLNSALQTEEVSPQVMIDTETAVKRLTGRWCQHPRYTDGVPSTPVAAIDIQTAAALSATGAITRHDTGTGDAVWLVMAAGLAQSLWEWDERPSAAERAKVRGQN